MISIIKSSILSFDPICMSTVCPPCTVLLSLGFIRLRVLSLYSSSFFQCPFLAVLSVMPTISAFLSVVFLFFLGCSHFLGRVRGPPLVLMWTDGGWAVAFLYKLILATLS